MNKRGFFFTALIIVLVSLFVLSYTIYSSVNERKVIQKRVETLNDLVFSIEKDLSRQLFTSGFRIIFSMENKIVQTGNYITDFDSSTQELFYNGTLYGEMQEVMPGATFEDIQNSLNAKANKINANVTISSPHFNLSQSDPWKIKATLSFDIFVEDQGKLASWNKTETIVSFIPIEGFEDPLYFISTNGKITNIITKTPFTSFVSGTNVSNLLNHTQDSYYIANADAPNFINRLQGLNNPDENGIESLIYLPKLSSQGISVQDKSVVDHIYFSSANPTANKVQGMPSWFKIDTNHQSTYDVSGIII